MVAAGLLDTAEDHGYAVTSFSFKMRTCASSIMSPTTGQPLKVKFHPQLTHAPFICIHSKLYN